MPYILFIQQCILDILTEIYVVKMTMKLIELLHQLTDKDLICDYSLQNNYQ